MSSHSSDTKRITTADIAARKGGEKIVALTAYTAPVAHILDAHVDVLLVGDSLGMVVYGMETTLGVTLEMMIAHGRAVAGASARACVIVDMPFGSYQASGAQAFENCAKVMAQTGAQGVKLEGGAEMAETIRFLTERGIPVMGHVGMMPQRVHAYGGFKQQGKSAAQAEAILADAKAVADAGAFSIVLEAIPDALAEKITAAVTVPTIGIGAGPQCDGQVLVVDDMMGLTARTPKFVKRYAEMGGELEKAVRDYAEDVRKGRFPG